MRVQAYTFIPGVLTITVATPRVEAAPSHLFTFAKEHEEIAAKVRALFREYRQVGAPALATAAPLALATYFPAHAGAPLYAIRELAPAGTARDVDADFQLEITRVRFAFTVNLLPAAFLTDETVAEAIEYHLEAAAKQVITAAGVTNVFKFGDEEVRRGDRTEIDCGVEIGAPQGGRTGVEVPL